MTATESKIEILSFFCHNVWDNPIFSMIVIIVIVTVPNEEQSLLHDRQPQEYLGDIYAHQTGWTDDI